MYFESPTLCSPCPAGTFMASYNSASECEPCPLGQYEYNVGMASCRECARNKYTPGVGTVTCTDCPNNSLTARAGTGKSVDDCVSPIANFVQGVIAFVASFIIAIIYILYGRMNAVAFGRKRHLQEVGKTYIALMTAILRVPLTAKPKKSTDFVKLAKRIAFLLVGVLVFVGTTFMLCFMIFGQVFFAAMIIWKNVHLSIAIDFIARMTEAVGRLDEILGAALPVKVVFGWIIFVVEWLASLDINLEAAEVTCVGSQAPIQLLINLALFVAIVILIECDVAAFLATSFYRTHQEYRSVVANSKARHTVDYPPRVKLWHWLLSTAETGIFSSRLIVNVLQYVVSFISLKPFFTDNAFHAKTVACDDVFGMRYMDTALAVGSSVILYCMIPALLYTISKLLVPRLLKKDKKQESHTQLVKSVQNQKVTLPYSFVPSVDYIVSWRFKWAYNVLNTPSYANKDKLMFQQKSDLPLKPPAGIGMCPLVSTQNEDFQHEWVNECEERLPPYGLFFFGACMRYLQIVLKNFWTFFNVMLGVWNANSVRKFNIVNTLVYNGFNIANYLEQPEYESSSKTPIHESLGKLLGRCFSSDQQDSEFIPEDGGESRLQVFALVAAELSTRATLFMLIPFGSLITTYVSSTSANPIFCRRAKKLSKLLPGLLIFDSHLLAEKRVRQMGAYAHWKMRLMSIYIFVTESRLIKYQFSLLIYTMTLSVVFYPVFEFLALGVVIILLYCMFASLYPIIVIANIFEINDDEEVEKQQRVGQGEADFALQRQSSERRSSFLRPVNNTAADDSGPNYNFYADADEVDSEDEDANAVPRGSIQAETSKCGDVELSPMYQQDDDDALVRL